MRTEDWSSIDYPDAVERQLALTEEVYRGSEDVLVFCQHPPIVTLGRATTPDDVFGWDGPVFESSRGGRATYHGPSQLVVYPILNLSREKREYVRARDLGDYLRTLEMALIQALTEMGVRNCGRKVSSESDMTGRHLQNTGVWVNNRKIAAIGIAVKRWVSYHGIAVNLYNDSKAFSGIKPCGFSVDQVTSVEQETGERIPLIVAREILEEKFKSYLK